MFVSLCAMASPLKSGKQAVNLASGEVRVSKIRRDPPPPVKLKAVRHPDEIDRPAVVVGVIAVALALFVITLAFSSYSGWSPSEYTLEINAAE